MTCKVTAFVLFLTVLSTADAYDITKLTYGGLNTRPQVSNGYISWEGPRLYDVASRTTKFLGSGYIGGMYGNRVAWNTGSSWGADAWFYDGQNSIQLTATPKREEPPSVSNNLVAWSGNGSAAQTDYEIYVYNDLNVSRITTNSSCDTAPVAGDGIVAWSNCGTWPCQFMMYDMLTATTSVLGTGYNDSPRVCGTRIAWGGADFNIWLHDDNGTRQLTTDTSNGGNTLFKITDSFVLYSRYNSQTGKNTLMINDGRQEKSLFEYSSYKGESTEADLCGDLLVWTEQGQQDALYWCNINNPVRNLIATGDNIYGPGISGNIVVWENKYSTTASDIYYTVIPEPASVFMLVMGAVFIVTKRKWR